jgi:hypothetical protein
VFEGALLLFAAGGGGGANFFGPLGSPGSGPAALRPVPRVMEAQGAVVMGTDSASLVEVLSFRAARMRRADHFPTAAAGRKVTGERDRPEATEAAVAPATISAAGAAVRPGAERVAEAAFPM